MCITTEEHLAFDILKANRIETWTQIIVLKNGEEEDVEKCFLLCC